MFGRLAHNHATKPSNPSPRASAESLLEALRARDELTPIRIREVNLSITNKFPRKNDSLNPLGQRFSL